MKRISNLLFALVLICLVGTAGEKQNRYKIDLKGEWIFSDTATVQLPGTTDTNKKGNKNTYKGETTHLTRLYPFVGKARYSKEVEIPKHWKGKYITLTLERTKPSSVWVDGKLAGTSDDISTAQVYDLSLYLTPGSHRIDIDVDNGKTVPPQLLDNSHAYTESTQTNWNGIIGEIALEAREIAHISSIRTFPDVGKRSVKVEISIASPEKIGKKASLILSAEAWNTDKPHKSAPVSFKIEKGKASYTFEYPLGKDAQLWSEFHPALYRLTATLGNGDCRTVDFGLREFKAKGSQFSINGNITFLRGKHDACVFPLIAHTAMDVDSWRHYFKVAKSYGINHYRFHSWCPPEACFKAADIEGIYLQAELPFWGSMDKNDSRLVSFLEKEGLNIQKAYGNHASFVMFALGNELWGDQATMKDMIEKFRAADNRRLYAYGSNNSLGFNGHIPGEDFLVTCRIGGEAPGTYTTHTRASFSFADAHEGGLLNHSYPNTEMNFSKAIANCHVPVIGHETGQYQIYPDYDEIKKYTGVLYPYNFEVFRKRLQDAGMGDQAHDFFLASGKWAVELYRADIEMNLRTPGFAGFQLLDLQDYPGQGTALVGILDAFMDSKGLISPEEWRHFCSPVVPLLEIGKFCWKSNEQLSATVKIADYAENPVKSNSVTWIITDTDGKMLYDGKIPFESSGTGLISVGGISTSLSKIEKPSQINLKLSIDGTAFSNSYRLWVYPEVQEEQVDGIITTDSIDASIASRLEKGARVLWYPNHKEFEKNTVGGLMQTDYWNYRMFKTISENAKKPVSPGTMGILTDPAHPALKGFPTSFHTDWQWFPIIKSSRPFILDNMPSSYRPIVQVIDNVERNHKLGLLFEFAVGKGKLLVCMADLESVCDKPEAACFRKSIIDYAKSADFNPSTKFDTFGSLVKQLTSETKTGDIKELKNISYE